MFRLLLKERVVTLHVPVWCGPTLTYSNFAIDKTLLKLTLINLKVDNVRYYN